MNIKFAFLLFLLTVNSAYLSAAEPPPQFAIGPGIFNLQIGKKPVSDVIKLVNLGNQTADVQVSVITWDLDENNQIRVQPSTESTLDQSIIFSPSRFTIKPKSTQAVRFSIRPRIELPPGEHRALIQLKQVTDPNVPDNVIKTNFSFGIAIYGYVGEPQRLGILEDIAISDYEKIKLAEFDIASNGNANVRMISHYAILKKNHGLPQNELFTLVEQLRKKEIEQPEKVMLHGMVPKTPVLAGTRRTIKLPLEVGNLDSGDYVLVVNGTLGEEPLQKIIAFTKEMDTVNTIAKR